MIVGAGIAGCCAAITAEKRGFSVTITDPHPEKATSQVAAGLFNPITGRQFSLTWNAKEIFDYLPDFYEYAEKMFDKKFFYQGSLYRPFPDAETQERFEKRKEDNDLKEFISPDEYPLPAWYKKTDFGGIWLKKGGWLNTPAFIEATLNHFKENMITKRFELEEVKVQAEGLDWQGVGYDYILLCKGVWEKETALGKQVPFTPVKGEILTIAINSEPYDMAFSANKYLLPLDKGIFKAGATYSWDLTDAQPSQAGKNELIAVIQKLSSEPFEVLKHEAGIRPAMQGRRPIAGWLKTYKGIGILNGLGSKGISLAPYLAHYLFENLEKGTPLPMEADISRFGI